MLPDNTRKVAMMVTLPMLTAVFSVGGAVATARHQLGAKLDTTSFALFKAKQVTRDTLMNESITEIRDDLRVLVCDRYPDQPKCIRSGLVRRR